MNKIDFYENRSIQSTENKSSSFFLEELVGGNSLIKSVSENDKIILLGNPGIGKTTELLNLFDELWDKISENGLFPFFINLKNFRSINKFEDLIANSNWRNFSQIIFILDGLDETSDIEDFISALELFINKNKNSNYKFVLSCRTNIYNKYLINISNFKCFYLDELSFKQSESILFNKYNIKLNKLDLKKSHYDYLKTPFFLNLFAEFYLDKNRLPDSDAKIWSTYIDRLLNEHKNKLKKQRLVSISDEIFSLMKIALINEFRHQNFITENDLSKVFGHKKNEFIENPFIVNSFGGKEFSFENRQIQEYFVANSLSEKGLDDIIKNIKIPDLNKVHPILFNSVSFLINLIEDEDKRKALLEWIEENEIELFFKADSDRISDQLRNRIFQNYFQKHCIEKTYWISTSTNLSVKEISEFAQSIENYNYLIKQIEENRHFRLVISAIEILSFFNLKSLGRVEVTKKLFIDILKNIEYSHRVKSSVINCISLQLFTKNDIPFLNSILSIFKNSSNKEINRAILSLLLEQESIDKYFDFIFEEFLYENKIKEREIEDNVMRGTNYVLAKLILKLENSENFIQFAKYFFDNEYRFYVSSDDLNDIVEKALEYQKNDSKFIVSLLENMNIKKINFFFENSLNYLITNSTKESKIEVIKYLLNKSTFKDISYQLSVLVDSDTIELVIEFLKDKLETEQKEIDFFRNRLSNRENRTVGKFFNEKMEELGYVFTENWYSDDKIKHAREDFKNKPQENFNLLFDKNKLFERINQIFKNSSEELDLQMYHTIEKEWYEKNGHWQRIDSSYEIIRTILINIREKLNYDELTSNIDDDFLINEIISDIENFSKNVEIKVEQYQLEYITDWINKRENEIDFDSIIKYNNYDRFSLLKDYKSWENIIFFARKFDIVLSDDFMLKSLNISYVRNFNEDESLFIFLSNKISNKVALTQKIVENLQQKKFNSFIAIEHIKYVLEKNIEKSYSDVRSLLLEEKIEYNLLEILKKYYELTHDISFLKECTSNLETQKAWDAIILILEYKIENEFVEEKALLYLDKIEERILKNYLTNSLHVLFKLNKPSALKFFMKHMKDEYNNSLRLDYYGDFNAVEDYQDLIILFDTIYLDESFERSFNSAQNILNQCITNLSSSEDSYSKVHDLLIDKREELKKSNQDNGIFYINLLIDLCENSYYNSKSKPLSFEKALKKAEEILN